MNYGLMGIEEISGDSPLQNNNQKGFLWFAAFSDVGIVQSLIFCKSIFPPNIGICQHYFISVNLEWERCALG